MCMRALLNAIQMRVFVGICHNFEYSKKKSEICIWIHMRRTTYDKQSCVRMANNQVAGIIFLFVYWPLGMCIDYYDKFPVHIYVDYGMCVEFESMLIAMQNVAHLDSCPWLESYVHISVFEAIKRSPNKSFYVEFKIVSSSSFGFYTHQIRSMCWLFLSFEYFSCIFPWKSPTNCSKLQWLKLENSHSASIWRRS